MVFIDIPNIKNKYLRWCAATVGVAFLLVVIFPVSVFINVFSELKRTWFNLDISGLVGDDLTTIKKGVVELYSGKRGGKL